MNILITGANGQLGTELQKQLAQGRSELGPLPEKLLGAQVFATDVDTLDITNRSEVVQFVKKNVIDVIFSCAAYTNVDGCEAHREDAFRVNAIGARNLAIAADKIGARLVHVSTDYVFSGNAAAPVAEYEQPAPVSVYGKTKLAGEAYVQSLCKRYFIVRTAWLYGYVGKNFVKTMLNAGRKFGKLEVVNDQLGNPTNAVDLAHHLLALCVTKEYGVYHCTGEGICSWYDFASEIIRLGKVDATVTPCTSTEYKAKHPEAAARPAYSALENTMLACTVGNHMRPWQDALAEFFKNYKEN